MNRFNPSCLDELINGGETENAISPGAPASCEAASDFWEAAFASNTLAPRLRELILIALHGTATAVNEEAIRRHIARAKVMGATDADILDVLLSIVGVANHALYFAVPILMDEITKSGDLAESELPEFQDDIAQIREEFVATRGFWNEQRDMIARLMPDYFRVLSRLSMEPWKSGVLSPKERELIYIAIDCSVTHMYEAGLRIHIRHARQQGASREEILEVFQLAALCGMEGYIIGCQALNKKPIDSV